MQAARPLPPAPADPSGVARIASADGVAILERLAGTDLLERGSVTVISVQAIRERVGSRWPRKRDDVWGYVERRCEEHLSFQDIRHRINETDFLIAMVTEEGVAAQAVSLKILEEVLVFFLGAAEVRDLTVRAVTGVEGETVVTAELSIERLRAAGPRPPRAPPPEIDPREARRRNPISFVTVAGERVRVDFAVEEVVSVRHRLTAALRIQPTVRSLATGAVIATPALRRLDDDDIAFIDRSTLDYGALFLPEDGRVQPPLILPVSFRTMGCRKGRNALIGMGGAVPEQTRRSVLLELVDVDSGTPTARLAEVAALLSQLSRGVMARIWPARDALAPVRGVRLQGITLDVREFAWDDLRLAALLRVIGEQLDGKTPASLAQGLPDGQWMDRVAQAGFSLAAIAAAPMTAPAAE